MSETGSPRNSGLVRRSYAVGVLFALTQGPIFQIWWGRPREEGIPVRAAILASFILVQLPALWMLASRGELRGRITGALRWLLVLVGWLSLSVAWATLGTHSIVEVLTLVTTVATGLWFVTSFRPTESLWITWTAMQLGVLWSVFAIWRGWPGSVGRSGEWVGIYFNRNSLAPPTAVAVVVSVWLVARLVRAGRWRAGTAVAGIMVADTYVLVRTGSENLAVAGLIGLGVSLAAWWAWPRASDRIGRNVWRAVAGGVVVIPWTFTFGVRVVGGWFDVSRIGGREGLWLISLDGFWAKPWFGWGWLSAWHTPQFFPRELWTWWRTLGGTWSHSGYFDLLLGGGLVAFALFVAATAGALLGRRGPGADPIHAGLAAMVLAAMTQESFFIGSHFLTVLLLVGLFSPRLAPAVRGSATTAR